MAKETSPAKSRQILTREQARIKRHLESRGLSMPERPDHVDAKGMRTVYAEKNPDVQDNIRLVNHYKSLGYEVSEDKEGQRFALTIEQSKFEENERKSHAAHQARVRREAKPKGDLGGGWSETGVEQSDEEITDIDDLLEGDGELAFD